MVWKPSKNRSVCLIVTILRAHGYTAEFEFGQRRVLPAQPVFHPQDDRNELYLPTHSWYSVNDSHMTRLFVFSLASLFSGIWVDFRPNVWHRNDYEANIRYSPRKEYLLLSFFTTLRVIRQRQINILLRNGSWKKCRIMRSGKNALRWMSKQ